jgi:DNA polymerase I
LHHQKPAEFNCHLALGWQLPYCALDLFTEFRNTTNGLSTPCGAGLVGALTYYGLSSIEAADKASMRELALRAGGYTHQEKTDLLDYCESDVDALKRLLPAMLPTIDLPRAILRGRYMKSAARIEHAGIPLDRGTLNRLELHWETIQDQLIAEVDQHYGVYEGRTFKAQRFADWLISNNVPWPVLPSGKLDLKDNTFKDMARTYPQIAPLRELRIALSQMRLSELAVGPDDRNRCLLSPFRSRTGRNQPSNTRFIFGPAVWLRNLIKPKQGYGLAYIDWSQQEFGIAAALSNDPLMKKAYSSGDPYLSFAIQAGAVPPDATKKTHKAEREQFKACVLAVQYGMGAESLSLRINQPVIRARELLRLHRDTYRVFWRWSEDGLNYAMLYNKIWTVFGWTLQLNANPSPRSLSNFPMQANGAEMLRLACCLVTEAGITVCAPIHDALLIEAPLDQLDAHIQKTQTLMAGASSIVLNGFALRSDVDIVRYPERYRDDRGVKMWETVSRIIDDLEPQPVRSCTPHLCVSAPPSPLIFLWLYLKYI